jgi:hypothetical protein
LGLWHKFTASYIKTSTVSIKENSAVESSVTQYPNPVFNILHIETDNTNSIPEVKIYSMQGTLMMTAKGNQINVSSLLRGMYIVKISTEVGQVVRKVLKE